MDPSKFAGMPWDTWLNHVETQRKPEETVVNIENEGTSKLPKEDMKIYQLCPAMERVEVVVCEECTTMVRPQALHYHYENIHREILAEELSYEKPLPVITEEQDSPLTVTPSVESSSGNLFGKDHDTESMNDKDDSENTKIKSQCLSKPTVLLKRLKQVETQRYPLSQMCSNKRTGKKTKSSVKKKLKPGSPILLSINSSLLQEENVKSNSESPFEKRNDGIDSLKHLPEMSLNLIKEQQISIENSCTNSITLISKPPRPLSVPPLFSCHKAGGLFYSGRHMNVTRQGLEHWVGRKPNIPNHVFQQPKIRRKNPINWQTNDNTIIKYK